jgi:hypothetical protein
MVDYAKASVEIVKVYFVEKSISVIFGFEDSAHEAHQ